MLKIGMRIEWRSYKIDGKWYEGVIISIDTRGTKRKRNPEYHIQTGLPGTRSEVIRVKADIRKLK